MGNNIVKRQFEEQIRFLLLQFPLDVNRVAQDASEYFGTDVSIEQVVRIQKKMKSHQDRDTAVWVASNIAQKLFQSVREREAKLEAMFATWAGAEKGRVSVCCRGPVEKKEDMSGNTYYFCLVCCEDCYTRTAHYLEIEKLKIQILRELRKEADLLVKFAKDLGFTVQSQQPKQVEQNTNFFLVNPHANHGQQQQGAVPIDAQAAKRLEEMSPTERERVIKNLEQMAQGKTPIVDTDFVSDSSDKEKPSDQ